MNDRGRLRSQSPEFLIAIKTLLKSGNDESSGRQWQGSLGHVTDALPSRIALLLWHGRLALGECPWEAESQPPLL